MFFDNLSDLPHLAKSAHATIFAISPDTAPSLPHSIIIEPQKDKSVITIDQIREVIERSQTKQTRQQYVIIKHAELLSQESSNALLKLLEEPNHNHHYVLLTLEPSALLPTILSRANLFIPRKQNHLSKSPDAAPEILALAKKLLTATPTQLPALADEIAKDKTSGRANAISATAVAIELAYKSYFATKKPSFLAKIPNLLKLHQNLKANGNLKLHIVADLC